MILDNARDSASLLKAIAALNVQLEVRCCGTRQALMHHMLSSSCCFQVGAVDAVAIPSKKTLVRVVELLNELIRNKDHAGAAQILRLCKALLLQIDPLSDQFDMIVVSGFPQVRCRSNNIFFFDSKFLFFNCPLQSLTYALEEGYASLFGSRGAVDEHKLDGPVHDQLHASLDAISVSSDASPGSIALFLIATCFSQVLVKCRENSKTHFQHVFGKLVGVLKEPSIAFTARMAAARVCLSIAAELPKPERLNLVRTQRLTMDILRQYLQSVAQAGG